MVSVGSPSVGWEGRKPKRKDSYCRKATSNKPVSLWDPSVRQLLGFAPFPQSPKNLLPPSLFNQSFFCKLKQSKPTRNEILNLILLESKRASPLVAFFALKWRESICKFNRREMNKQRNSEMNKQCKKVKSATVEILSQVKMWIVEL